jgi:hypothetical protein
VLHDIRKARAAPELAACLAAARRLHDETASLNAVNVLERFASGQNVPPPDMAREAPDDEADDEPWSPDQEREYERATSDLADRILEEERTSALRDQDLWGDEQWIGVLLHALRRASGERRTKIVAALLAVVRIIDHDANN